MQQSLFFVTLTFRCRCAFDVQCVSWINNKQWMFDFSLLTMSGEWEENMPFFVFVVSCRSLDFCDWPTHTRVVNAPYPRRWNLPLQARRPPKMRSCFADVGIWDFIFLFYCKLMYGLIYFCLLIYFFQVP